MYNVHLVTPASLESFSGMGHTESVPIWLFSSMKTCQQTVYFYFYHKKAIILMVYISKISIQHEMSINISVTHELNEAHIARATNK